ncbi:hypothetical protein AB0J28_09570 [Streptosporangium canum]|uniref:hypothetical protein n=1 Tax=Streptosporangium canum TaxID=324952 RepID=UPI003431D254
MTTVTQTLAKRPVAADEFDVTDLGARVARELAVQKHLNTLPAQEPLRIIRVAADLKVGDWLDLGDREVLVTKLIPATRAEVLEHGEVEIRSGSWWDTLPAGESVKASPRQAVTR